MITMALPKSTQPVLDSVPRSERHPGLQLDKLSPLPGPLIEALAKCEREPGRSWDQWLPAACMDQQHQKAALAQVVETRGDPALLAGLRKRREAVLTEVAALQVRCVTAGPFTVHLARASALENAGLCLQYAVFPTPCIFETRPSGQSSRSSHRDDRARDVTHACSARASLAAAWLKL